jgi:uncharacterized membrane protein YkvA (DUF1232 family)
LLDVPFLFNRFISEVRATNGAILIQRMHFIIYIICFLTYFLSPLDLIPEFIFGAFGLIDDIIVCIYVIFAISSVFYQFMVERNQEAFRAR